MNLASKNGATPLYLAAAWQRDETLLCLLEAWHVGEGWCCWFFYVHCLFIRAFVLFGGCFLVVFSSGFIVGFGAVFHVFFFQVWLSACSEGAPMNGQSD